MKVSLEKDFGGNMQLFDNCRIAVTEATVGLNNAIEDTHGIHSDCPLLTVLLRARNDLGNIEFTE